MLDVSLALGGKWLASPVVPLRKGPVCPLGRRLKPKKSAKKTFMVSSAPAGVKISSVNRLNGLRKGHLAKR